MGESIIRRIIWTVIVVIFLDYRWT
jgi:hypothetical protein